VVFVGSFAPWQGIDLILAAAQEPSWPPQVRLVFAGAGREVGAVSAAASQSDLIDYLGPVPYNDVPGLLARSIAALSTSRPREIASGGEAETGASPLKLYEAMACGTPVIATDHPGQAELVRTFDCGVLVRPDSPTDVAEAVARIWTKPDEGRAMGRRGRAAIESRHSWDARAADTDRVLRHLVGQGARESSRPVQTDRS
jgi:glycosyltransferase involved in cell wall biosynthesis